MKTLLAKTTDGLIDRSAFVYLSPKGKKDEFAQCESCQHFNPSTNRCAILGPDDIVFDDSSCGLYTFGSPSDDNEPASIVTAEQAGLVEGPVRCRNCAWSDGKGKCDLYKLLNRTNPEVFKLDENIEADGCCNAWTKE